MSDMTLKELLNTAKHIRTDKQELERDVKVLSASLEEIKEQIRTKMHAEGIERTSVDGITVSLSDATVYNIADYGLFHDFIMAEGHTGLLQRRVSNIYVKDLLKTFDVIPGLVPFAKENVNLRVG
tara:strand:- start:704 stop:1078 length:375 start_codon:yes stop_codon:yes gene_type:complete